MSYNQLPILASALIPLLVGYVWYHDRVFGSAWRKAAGLDGQNAPRKPKVFILTALLGVLVAGAMLPIVIHQSGVTSLFVTQPGFSDETSEMHRQWQQVMQMVAGRHRHFGHGALHGAITAVALVFPVLAVNAMFERKPWRYTFINAGYWLVTLVLMGGVICQFA